MHAYTHYSFHSLGEAMYIARISIDNELRGFPCHVLPSYITNSSKKAISYFTLERSGLKPDFFYSQTYEVLTCKIPDLLYWQSPESLNNYDFNSSVIFSQASPQFSHSSFALFYGQIKNPADDMTLAKLSKKFNAPLVGLGFVQPNDDYLLNFSCKHHFYTVRKKKVVENMNFLVLCVHQPPPMMSHYCFPSINWVDVSDGHLPLHAFPISATQGGDVLYFAKGENKKKREIFFAKVRMHSEKLQYLNWVESFDQKYFTFSILAVEDPMTIEWCPHINEDRRKISPPLNSVPICCSWCHQKSCIARKVIGNGDISDAVMTNNILCDARARFMGITVSQSGICSCAPLDREAFQYSTFDVMVAKISPKNLKQLCRNVIIAATLAIPGRIDQLSLPDFLKDYCKLTQEDKLQIPTYK